VVKEFLHERNVSYELRDLRNDPLARDDFVRAGYLLPPVTVIDSSAVMGFDPIRLDELLAARSAEPPRDI
jgi:hypothetical protein